MAADRARTRDELLAATEARLARVAAAVAATHQDADDADEIGVKVGKIINRYKVGKHFDLTIDDNRLRFERNDASIARETPLDGIYIIRTSERADAVSAADVVRTYKSLGHVEQAFRCLKGVDLRVRPIRHRNEAHVRAHIFLCMLAYYVEHQLAPPCRAGSASKTLSTLRFLDPDPVATAEPSATPVGKILNRHHRFDRVLVQSLRTVRRAWGRVAPEHLPKPELGKERSSVSMQLTASALPAATSSACSDCRRQICTQ